MTKEEADARVSALSLLGAILLIRVLVGLSACVSAPVAPNLTLPPIAKECPKKTIPAVPQTVHLTIEGDKVEMDEGGEIMLRNYVRARSLLR